MGKSGGCQGQMRSQCSLILPAGFISQCRLGGLVGYAVLYPSAAPEERRLDPARGAWSVFMQMAAVEWSRADSSTPARSFIPEDTSPLTSRRPRLFFPPKGSSCYQNRAYIQYYWTSRLFPDIEPKHMAYVCIKANRQDKIKGSNIVRNFIQVDRRMPLRGLLVKLE